MGPNLKKKVSTINAVNQLENDKLKQSQKNVGDELSPAQQLCHIGRIPSEILDQIFRYLDHLHDRNSVRLVCKLWYRISVCNLSETAWINIRGNNFPWFLENNEIVHMKINFENVPLNELPTTFWQKVGPKIHSLSLVKCQLSHQVITNVALFCDNLKLLRIVLNDNNKMDESLCHPISLEMVKIVRKQLKSLEINIRSQELSYYQANERDFEIWKRICTALCKIFPDVVHYTYAPCSGGGGKFGFEPSVEFTVSKDFCGTSRSDLGTCLAGFLCHDRLKGWVALNALSTIRLTTLSVTLPYELCREMEVRTVFDNLFTSQKKLTSVKIHVPEFLGGKTHNFIVDKIFDSCRQLRNFEYHPGAGQWLEEDNEFYTPTPELITKTFNIQNFSFGFICGFTNKYSASSLSINGCLFHELPTILMHKFNLVQHLTLTKASDELLQNICQYMTDLKTLKITINHWNTNFGLSGRRRLFTEDLSISDSRPRNSVGAYSISRLQNLEQLRIERFGLGYGNFNAAIYSEFHFPKLHYLRCFPPEDLSSFTLPSLKVIDFTGWSCKEKYSAFLSPIVVTVKYLLNFCRFTKNLHTLRVGHMVTFTLEEVKQIFDVCPSLRILDSLYYLDYCDPFTREIKRVDMSTISIL